MPWKDVTVNEERQGFLQEHKLGYYFVSDLADRFFISRQTAHKWTRRADRYGEIGFPRALPPPPFPDRSCHYPGGRHPPQGPPLLGRSQASRPPAPRAPLPTAPFPIHRLPHSPP